MSSAAGQRRARVAPSSSGLATYSIPSAYDLLFGWTGNTVTLSYRPSGSAVIAANAASNPDNLAQWAEAWAFARLEFDLTVDPSVPSASLLAASGWFGPAASGAATSGSVWAYGWGVAVGRLDAIPGGDFLFIGAQGQESTVAASQGIPYNGTAGFNFCGGTTVSNNPVQTGDVLCGSFGSGSMLRFRTQNSAEARMISDPYYTSASAWASTDAAWSTTFETSLYATTVPEPDMSLKTQAKILRVLQEKSFERVGGNEIITVDARVIAATNKDLKEEVKKGAFREDLFYRLNVIPFHVPPLRERRDDIPLLLSHFLKEFAAESAREAPVLSREAIEVLCGYRWPGNVRELRNLVERLVIMARSNTITPEDIPTYIKGAQPAQPAGLFTSSLLKEARRDFEREFIVRKLRGRLSFGGGSPARGSVRSCSPKR